ncbi:MAG: hypothetical protein ACTSRA_03385, partial [Promethearchaeota archaeon]
MTGKIKVLVAVSFPWSRAAVTGMLLLSSWFQYVAWGADLISEYNQGNWLFLGGPSLWYPTGFFPLIYSTFLIV